MPRFGYHDDQFLTPKGTRNDQFLAPNEHKRYYFNFIKKNHGDYLCFPIVITVVIYDRYEQI